MPKVVTYNVNHSRRAEGAYAAFSWESRRDDVVALLRSLEADILMIQEIPCVEVEWFESQFPQHHWSHKNEPGRGGAFTAMATGVRTNISEHFGKFGERPDSLCVYWPATNCGIVNVHLPMETSERSTAANNIVFVKTANTQIKKWIVAGDFNAFPDQGGSEMMLQLNAELGTYSGSEFARSRVTGELATKTFRPYPYDYVPETALAMAGKLDHVLVKGFVTKSALVDDSPRPKHNWTPSDHFPVVLDLL